MEASARATVVQGDHKGIFQENREEGKSVSQGQTPPPRFIKLRSKFLESTIKKCENTWRDIIQQDSALICEEIFHFFVAKRRGRRPHSFSIEFSPKFSPILAKILVI